jgi:hypothetical protein
MPEIPSITSPNINIREIDIPQVVTSSENYTSVPLAPPVVVNIGVPIVDVPGCVEAHEANNNSKTLGSDDQRGLVTYCDAGVPSYNPINFEPEQIVPTAPAGVDTRRPEKPDPPGQVELPPAAAPATAKIDCPTPAQQAKEPVGTYIEGFRKKVTDYQLIGNECVQITEPVSYSSTDYCWSSCSWCSNYNCYDCCCCHYISTYGKTVGRHPTKGCQTNGQESNEKDC